MGLFDRKKKKQLEAEWQVVEGREGESIFDLLDRIANARIAEKEASGSSSARGNKLVAPRTAPSDGEWLMAASIQRLSTRQTLAGLESVRAARKLGVN